MEQTAKRYPELDLLRAGAVLAMISYHVCFDLSFYYGYDLSIDAGIFRFFAHATASLFLVLTGICFVISFERTAPEVRLKKYLKRASIVLAGAMTVTLVTWLFDPQTFVVFGILHLIGVAALIQYLVRPLKRWNVLPGVLIFSTALFLPTGNISTPLLLPLGIMNEGFSSVDYYPLLPWLGPIFIGMGIGDFFYTPERSDLLSFLDTYRWPSWLLWIGRKSLLIYFVHQPIALLLLWLLLGR